MTTHKPSRTSRHKVDGQARQARKVAKRKLYLGLRKDPRSGYRMARSK